MIKSIELLLLVCLVVFLALSAPSLPTLLKDAIIVASVLCAVVIGIIDKQNSDRIKEIEKENRAIKNILRALHGKDKNNEDDN